MAPAALVVLPSSPVCRLQASDTVKGFSKDVFGGWAVALGNIELVLASYSVTSGAINPREGYWTMSRQNTSNSEPDRSSGPPADIEVARRSPTSSVKTPPGAKVSLHHTFDIEHVPVEDDPRQWSPLRKNVSLTLIASGAMIAGLAGSIQNPAVKEMEVDLPATSTQFSLSISMFILVQGIFPLVWSAFSVPLNLSPGVRVYIQLVYLASLSLFSIGSVVVALSNSIGLVIGFRCFQAAGSSAVHAIGAATLADIFNPSERGTKMGIYYIAPLLGPALGPIFGGTLTTAFGWRAIFWFLTVVSGSILLAFLLLFKDTFRRERSLTYQNAVRKRRAEAATARNRTSRKSGHEVDASASQAVGQDLERNDGAKGEAASFHSAATIKLSLKDINPVQPLAMVLRRKNNIIVLSSSGLLFAFAFLITYTSARTLSAFYHFEALKIGLVTLCFGFGRQYAFLNSTRIDRLALQGMIAGSVLGGRWSDIQLARLKTKNGGIANQSCKMRLKSIIIGAMLLPPFTIAFGWICHQHIHVSAICIFLFLCGFLTLWVYSSTLAYIIDANNGRSSTAAACNSAFRGVSAFIATEIAVPMQDHLGDGWMYTVWGVIMALAGCLILLVCYKGEKWREDGETSEVPVVDG
ncbi:hypothetical protein NMY22_g1153 [Coprinellus aureogranulatus]|nr:hypothetical protein NMY22_g1153 [Coprinellus aureogranulatus]